MFFFRQLAHAFVELGLTSSICIDLTRVTTHHDTVELAQNFEKLVMLLMLVLQHLAAHTCLDEPVCNWYGIESVAVGQLVRSTVGDGAGLDLHYTGFELVLAWLSKHMVEVMRRLAESGGFGHNCTFAHSERSRGRLHETGQHLRKFKNFENF